MTIAAGIDVGTGAVKAAIFEVKDGESKWLARDIMRIRQRDPMQLSRETFDRCLEMAGITEDDIDYVATTGEGDHGDDQADDERRDETDQDLLTCAHPAVVIAVVVTIAVIVVVGLAATIVASATATAATAATAVVRRHDSGRILVHGAQCRSPSGPSRAEAHDERQLAARAQDQRSAKSKCAVAPDPSRQTAMPPPLAAAGAAPETASRGRKVESISGADHVPTTERDAPITRTVSDSASGCDQVRIARPSTPTATRGSSEPTAAPIDPAVAKSPSSGHADTMISPSADQAATVVPPPAATTGAPR